MVLVFGDVVIGCSFLDLVFQFVCYVYVDVQQTFFIRSYSVLCGFVALRVTEVNVKPRSHLHEAS